MTLRHLPSLSLLLSMLALSNPSLALEVEVKGLFKNGVIVEVDGRRHVLRAGERSPEGVLLLSADSKEAVLEIDGERQRLGMSRRIRTTFAAPENTEVRIASGRGGHYFTPGRINGQAVNFMVDTGATAVAMGLPTAQELGINYRAGRRISVSTANGVVEAFSVMLDSVRIGAIELKLVEATVTVGDFPREILLGNSYLNRVDMRRENGVLVLEARY